MPASAARCASNGPASASASTFTITMCLRCSQHASTCAMPAAGLPVASMITSIWRFLIKESASSVMCVVPLVNACLKFSAANCSSVQPTRRSDSCARSGFKSAMPSKWMPGVFGICDRYIEPNLPAPIKPTRTGLPEATRCCRSLWRFIFSPRPFLKPPMDADGRR